MRKVLCLIVALAACFLLVTVASAEETSVPTTCAAGCENPVWEPAPATQQEWRDLEEGHYHFYLEKNVSTYWRTPNAQNPDGNSGAPVTICLDLNGFNNTLDGRALGLYSSATVNIMDSSAEQTGYIKSRSGNNATVGGTIYLTGTLNLYSGSIIYEYDGTGTAIPYAGSVMHIGASSTTTAAFNMYGGQVIGGQLVTGGSSVGGGTIYLQNGSMNVSGGEIISGTIPDTKKGPCIYMENSSQITLSGDANVDNIYISGSNAKLNIDGTYSGKARVTTSATPSNGKVIGTGTNTPAITGDLMCTNGNGWLVNVDGSNVTLATFTPSATRHYCQHCKDIVYWTAMPSGNWNTLSEGHYHYYLTGNDTSYRYTPNPNSEVSSTNSGAKVTICLDLNGYHIDTSGKGNGRAIGLYSGCTLNIMDSSAAQTGYVQGTTGNNATIGGTMFAYGTFNLYSGTIRYVYDGVGTNPAYAGGVISLGTGYANATFNMYGGRLEGGQLVVSSNKSYGGTIYAGNGNINLYAGEIISGSVPEGYNGPCIYLSGSAKITLSGDANVDNIYFSANNQQLTVSGNYTGTASVTYGTELELGAVVGVSDNANISGSLTCTNGDRLIKVDGTNLITAIDAPVVVVDGETETGYSTLQEAITNCTSGYVKLLNSFSDDITVPHTVTVDLNGFDLTGTITLSEDAILYGRDSQTDDYTVEDGNGYGKVTDAAKITAAEGYLPVTEDDKISFHKVTIKITGMTLRPSVAGIYYKSSFLGDEKVAGEVESFGVALSVQETPAEGNLKTHCKYSTFQNFEAGATGNASTSTLLTGILKPGNTLLKNVRNLKMDVYGRPYIKTADGYYFGKSHTRDLAQQMQDIDEIFSTLGGSQRIALLDMFDTYQSALNSLSLPNTVAGKEKAENTLSILMVGNSFCYYYVEELYGLLMANPDPNRGYEYVEIYNLYKSGCTLTEHYNWWLSGAANYEGFYLTNENGRKSITPASGGKWNLEMTLQEGDWDYISLQGASTGNNYATGDIDTICASISSLAEPLLDRFHTLFPDAQLLWHRTWPFEIGRISGSTTYDEELLAMYNTGMQAACDYMCNEFDQDQPYDLKIVNSGAAWVIAREENAKLETSLIPVEGGLCARKGIRNEGNFPYFQGNPNTGDGYHDGDIGGGQFLNACVWYETITGQSVLDNTYQPTTENGSYALADEFVALLRNAAHAVGTTEE